LHIMGMFLARQGRVADGQSSQTSVMSCVHSNNQDSTSGIEQ
jgi:hypothetical protein